MIWKILDELSNKENIPTSVIDCLFVLLDNHRKLLFTPAAERIGRILKCTPFNRRFFYILANFNSEIEIQASKQLFQFFKIIPEKYARVLYEISKSFLIQPDKFPKHLIGTFSILNDRDIVLSIETLVRYK